jgi:hypothetical protein
MKYFSLHIYNHLTDFWDILHIYIYIFRWLYSPRGPWPLLFSFMIILQSEGLLGRVISSLQGLFLNTGQHKHRINTYTQQTSMPCVGFESTIPASKRAKTVQALDRSATVTGIYIYIYKRARAHTHTHTHNSRMSVCPYGISERI